MRRARFLTSVREDLLSIFDFVAESSGSIETAKSFVIRLRSRCHELAGHETMVGRPRPDLRSSPFGNYVIFFRYQKDQVEVVNIIERHRDIAAHFAAEDGT